MASRLSISCRTARAAGLDLAAGRDYLRRRGVKQGPVHIPDDFDEPLPEDILLRPLP